MNMKRQINKYDSTYEVVIEILNRLQDAGLLKISKEDINSICDIVITLLQNENTNLSELIDICKSGVDNIVTSINTTNNINKTYFKSVIEILSSIKKDTDDDSKYSTSPSVRIVKLNNNINTVKPCACAPIYEERITTRRDIVDYDPRVRTYKFINNRLVRI